ncbi:DUF4350 domain-containing protein [Planctellipticum variicoloris]|uniref:DUF4350 domain-containing protein n=1 Tax=Planctellipticum variicoloris TaxID=3064265 RepID=UPI003013F206|nr:DUF4350 domain-containing protein [Planctomycetaceae bacterium SH412]
MKALLRSLPAFLWPALILGTLSLHFWFPPLDSGTGRDTYSTTAEGQKAFYRLAGETWSFATRNTQPLPRALQSWDTEYAFCVLGPAREPTAGEWDAMLNWVASGGKLLYAFRGEDQAVPQLGVRYILDEDADDAAAPQSKLLDSPDLAWWTDGHLLAPGSELLVEHRGAPQAVKMTWGAGQIVFVASPLIFSNQLLTYGDNSILAIRLLEQFDEVYYIEFDESLNASGTPKSVGILFDPTIRPITIQLILLCFLYGWWNSRRFGPLLPKLLTPRQNIVDHTDALGSWYWKSRDGGGVLQTYLKQTLAELRGHATAAQERRRLEPIARRLNLTVDEVLGVLDTARSAAEKPRLTRRSAANWIRKLSELRAARRGK